VGGGTESRGLSLTEMYFIGVVIAAFLIIAGYNVLKIRKGKAGKKSK
jgi:uncharacterized membrane protein